MTDEEILEGLKAYTSKPEVIDKALNGLKSLEAWEKVKEEIEKESEIETLKLHWGEATGLNKAIEIIDKYRGDTDGNS